MREPRAPSAAEQSARHVAASLRDTLGAATPQVALVLGSGLGTLADEIEGPRRVPFGEIPGFRVAQVAGHSGAIVTGKLSGLNVVALAGRVHLYEGWTPQDAAFPVRVVHAMGAPVLFVSNAAGAMNPHFRPGDLMAIDDHINLMWGNPLIGPVVPGDQRFPDMSEPYDRGLRAELHAAADESGIPLADGVYAGLLGPSYETPAEVRMLRRLGADAVGMSTVPEVIVARTLGMRVAGVSFITNAASGSTGSPLSHAEVLETTAVSGGRFRALVRAWLARLR